MLMLDDAGGEAAFSSMIMVKQLWTSLMSLVYIDVCAQTIDYFAMFYYCCDCTDYYPYEDYSVQENNVHYFLHYFYVVDLHHSS